MTVRHNCTVWTLIFKRQQHQPILFGLILLLSITFVLQTNCLGQIGLSGYPFMNFMEGKNRMGGAMGIGYKKAVQEWWFNIEVFTYDKLIPIQDVFIPFNDQFTYKEEVKYTDVNVIVLFHKEITKPKRDIQGRVLFWELGGGINSLQRDQADATAALVLQAGLGVDFNKKIRVRLTPFVKIASESVTGVQISAFILIGLDKPIQTQVEE